uniref:Serine aminopeptidase S33 domain-containing protein n=1 Tax=Arcella intermedia TaxID=1963864 RepID=A0A6B2LH04_9EUKA
MVDDYQQFMILVFQDYPKETPFFMLGHGFGGHIALQLGLRIERGFKGVILSSVPLRNLESFGEGYSSWLLELGSLFPKLNYGYLYETSMLMRNKESLQQAYTDPRYYTGPIKIRPFCEILHNFDDIQENLNWIDWPILSLRGSSDPSLAPENTRDFFNGIPSKYKTEKIYEGCLHQLFDDPQHSKEILQDLLAWLHLHKASNWDAHKFDDGIGTCQSQPTLVEASN